MKLTRREFAKLWSAIGALALFPTLLLTGCADAVIAALDVAGAVAKSAAGILRSQQIAFGLAGLLETVSRDISKAVDLYHQYETIDATAKPGKFGEIQSILGLIHANLAEILDAAHVFNVKVVSTVTVAVAIVNTAIGLIISHLPQPHKAAAQAQRFALRPLPVIDGAKTANDLKKAWNDAVKAEHPEAIIQ